MARDNSLTTLTDEDLAQVVGGAGPSNASHLPDRSGEGFPGIDAADLGSVIDRELTLPARFAQAVAHANEQWRQAIEEGASRPVLEKEPRIAEEAAKLQKLVNDYRNALSKD
ncbi:hypothetical protein [Microvirga sp. TS319]|uniref:hypothetical protein n=1 Tax=Microvirga sp. TS319 TaxID=3241165 RepID=UPI00351AA0DC